VHFAVKPKDWWLSLGFTWSTMQLFRSEDDVKMWSAATGKPPGLLFPPARLWGLARLWYDDRPDLSWQRRTPAER
jgi:hypothetical protein